MRWIGNLSLSLAGLSRQHSIDTDSRLSERKRTRALFNKVSIAEMLYTIVSFHDKLSKHNRCKLILLRIENQC